MCGKSGQRRNVRSKFLDRQLEWAELQAPRCGNRLWIIVNENCPISMSANHCSKSLGKQESKEMLRRETERPGKIPKVGGQRVVCAGCLLRLGHKYQRGLAHSEESRAMEQCGSLCFAPLDTLTTAYWLLAALCGSSVKRQPPTVNAEDWTAQLSAGRLNT